MSGVKLPTLPGLVKEDKLSTLKPYRKRPLNIHKMLLKSMKTAKIPVK